MFFFFFQAEDGIRDVAVTGVQTCALPISASWSSAASGPRWANTSGSAVRRLACTVLASWTRRSIGSCGRRRAYELTNRRRSGSRRRRMSSADDAGVYGFAAGTQPGGGGGGGGGGY